MKVSIVTISFNQAEFLERTIRSVVEQDYKNIEYIIVDPGSTDGSREIIERYRDKIFKIIFDPDDGPPDGLNKGFSEASGDVYGFLNSDDILLPGAVTRVVNFFCDNRDVDVVSGHCIIIDKYNKKIRNAYSESFSLLKYAYAAVVQMQASTFFRSESFKLAGGFNPQNHVAWDGELFVDMGIKGAKFALSNEMWSEFRLHPESITSSKKLDLMNVIYQDYLFKKILGREKQFWDFPIMIMFRILKHLLHPRALYERLSKGPVYGRNVRI